MKCLVGIRKTKKYFLRTLKTSRQVLVFHFWPDGGRKLFLKGNWTKKGHLRMHMMSKGDIYHANCATIYNWWCIPNAKRERERQMKDL